MRPSNSKYGKQEMEQQLSVRTEKTGKKIEPVKTNFWNITRKRYLAAWLFMLPALIMLGVFTFYPLVYGVILAFFENNLIGQSRFVGIDNFTRAFQDGDFILALFHSGLYLIIVP